MISRAFRLAALALLATSATAQAATPPKRLNFVSCPMMRDTEAVPCWLAEYKGELYYLGIQLDLQAEFFPPQLEHQVLVEGVVSDKPRICGGIVLEPVRAAPLPEVDHACNTVLPAESYKIDFARRGTGPDPDTLSQRNQAAARAVEAPKPPYAPKTFTVYFDFDNYYMPTRGTRQITEAMRYATAIGAKKVTVTGYRGSALLSDGRKMAEQARLPEERTKSIQAALVDIGVKADTVSGAWKTAPEPADGVDDYLTRKVEIRVDP